MSPRRWTRYVSPILLERRVLLALLFIAGSIWGFLALGEEVSEGEQLSFDRAILLAFRNPADPNDPLGPPWFESAARDVTALGGTVVLTLMTAGVVGYLVLAGKRSAALFVVASIAGAMILSFAIKAGFERPRPDLVPHGVPVYTASFPSGHATGAAATYLTLGALLARFEARRWTKIYLLSVAVTLTVLIGLSRIYLGVHWPSDVLAGWTLGSSWALFCWVIARWLQRRGKVEGGANGS
ncbi:phosphatase PAP2 family protein [Benzoatithermus flavus]|uniref:Phosphatase PAP2 family protein n=1 Tax=Benzoatithermus flavus TaxID=3108223 RepID=A0ABU8XMV6_9PROT